MDQSSIHVCFVRVSDGDCSRVVRIHRPSMSMHESRIDSLEALLTYLSEVLEHISADYLDL